MAAYLLLLALFFGSGVSLFIIYSLFDDEEGARPWALRVFGAVFLVLLVRLGYFAGSPWHVGALFFAVFMAVAYLVLLFHEIIWDGITGFLSALEEMLGVLLVGLFDLLFRLLFPAKYKKQQDEEQQRQRDREEQNLRYAREDEELEQAKALQKRKAAQQREAQEAQEAAKWRADRMQRETVRLEREAASKARAEKAERERKAAVIRDLKNDADDGMLDF